MRRCRPRPRGSPTDEACRVLGYPGDELLRKRKTWAELTHPDSLADDTTSFHRVMDGKSDGDTLDRRWVRKDGQAVDTTTPVRCLRRDDGSARVKVDAGPVPLAR